MRSNPDIKPSTAAKSVEPFAPWPNFTEDEIEAATAVLRSGRVNYWTGSEVQKFEEEFADRCECKYAVAVANGTVSLEMALMALGVGTGDSVIVPGSSFVATATAVMQRGATPVFADVDINSHNLTVETVSGVLRPDTKAIIVVHLAGFPCDMDPIIEFARSRNIHIIEDCAQAHGAMYNGRPVGCFGDTGSFSFCQDKIISTGGEGGMLVTNNRKLWEKAWSYKDHGKDYSAIHSQRTNDGYQWVHNTLGTNWRMTEFQAAIGRKQLTKLDDWIKQRNENANYLTASFKKLPNLRVISLPDHITHAFYKYYTYIIPGALKQDWDRNRLMHEINMAGIPVSAGGCSELYLEQVIKDAGLGPAERLPVARQLGETSLMFLVHPTLTRNNLDATCRVVGNVLGQASA